MRKNRKITIDIFKLYIEERGGKLLAPIYLGWNKKHSIQCASGHIFEMDPVHVIYHNNWCKDCSGKLKSERMCREILRSIFNQEFRKCRPTFLKINNRSLELDGYCPFLSLAFEYNGNQHYQITPFSNSQERLDIIKERDYLKERLCQQENIKLIKIKQFPNSLSINKATEIIIKIINDLGLTITKSVKEISENVDMQYIFTDKISNFYIKLAKEKGGRIISDYGKSTDLVEWECHLGHRWFASPKNVGNGTWCPFCARNVKFTIEQVKKIGNDNGLILLSNHYLNSVSPLLWQCINGHCFERTLGYLQKRNSCPQCKSK